MGIKVGIDADILPYEIGFGCEKEGTKDWSLVRGAVDNRIKQIKDGVRRKYNGDEAELIFWLSDPEGVFRADLATILPYKGTRKAAKPYHWDGIRAYLRDNYGAQHLPRLEGDDCLAIHRGEYDVIASSDKDLRQLPGVYYSWARGKIPEQWTNVSPVDADRNFWKQMLTGDRVDNVLGLFGVGEDSTLVKKLYKEVYSAKMIEHVVYEYTRRFGRYWPMFFRENLHLLRLVDDIVWATKPYEYALRWLQRQIGVGYYEWVKQLSKQEAEEDTPSESLSST